MRHPKARLRNSKAQVPRYNRREQIKTQNPPGQDRTVNPFALPTFPERTAAPTAVVTSEIPAENVRRPQPIPAQLLPPTVRVETPRDANGKIRNVNITYGAYRSFSLCPAMFHGLRRKQDEKIESPRIKRQRRTGRIAEEIAAQPKGLPRTKRTKKLLQEVPRCERKATMTSVNKSVAVHDRMLKASTADGVFEQQQFSYVDVQTGWIFRAKPDLVEYHFQSDGSWKIRVVDEKTSRVAGEKTSRSAMEDHKGQLRFFGLVVNLVIKRQIAIAVKNGEKAHEFEIELVVRLTGEIEETEDAEKVESLKESDEIGDVRAIPDVKEQHLRDHVLKIQPGELENRLLTKVRKVCKWIDGAYAAGEFITRPGHCGRCPFRKVCPASSFVVHQTVNEKG
jgi:PD-(D/E)XK nuclease superfamily